MEKNNIEYKHNPLSQFDEIENSDSNSNKIETTSTEEESNENNNNYNKIIIINNKENKKNEEKINIINEKFLFKFKGKSLFIFGDKYGNPLFIIGPHWPMYFCYCGIVSLFMGILFFSQIWSKMSKIVRILGEIIYFYY